jgi:hypothetical protein
MGKYVATETIRLTIKEEIKDEDAKFLYLD